MEKTNNKLLNAYEKYCKDEENNRIREVIFKIIIKSNDNKIIDNNCESYQDYLKTLELFDFYLFFKELNIVIENYSIEFLINNKDDFYIKLDIYYPSLGSILKYINSQCIFPECNEKILNYSDNFCPNHLTDEIISNFELVNNCFNNKNKELKELYNNYKEQADLYNCLKNKSVNNDNIFKIKNHKIKEEEFDYFFELIEDVNDNISQLIEINLNTFKNLNDDLNIESDSDSDKISDTDSDIDTETENDLQNLDKTCNFEDEILIKNQENISIIEQYMEQQIKNNKNNKSNKNKEHCDLSESTDNLDDSSDDELDFDVKIDENELNHIINSLKTIN